MRPRNVLGAACAAAALVAATAGQSAPIASAEQGKATDYLVLFKGTSADQSAKQAISRAGGTITEVNSKLGYAFVRSRDVGFADTMSRSGAVQGVARDRTIGTARDSHRPKQADVERLTRERASVKGKGASDAKASPRQGGKITPEPLADLQWDMRQIGATANGSYKRNPGSQEGAGRRDRHRHRRQPPRHGTELRASR